MKRHVTAAISTAVIFLVTIVTLVMYLFTEYYLYFFLAVTSLFLGANSLFLILFKTLDTWSKQPKQEPVEEKKRKRKINYCLILKIITVAIYAITFYYSNANIYDYVKTLGQKEVMVPTIANVVIFLILFVLNQIYFHLFSFYLLSYYSS